MQSYSEWLQVAAEKKGISLSTEQLEQFALYYKRLVETNRQFNLTAITDEEGVYIKHFYDSLIVATEVPFNNIGSMIDIGTGAGFPGIPLKIAFPHLQLVLLDSLQKRISFMIGVVEELGLKDVQLIHGRAEEVGHHKNVRERFDLATARAVARLNVLAEYCLPFVKVGGYFVAMKGKEVNEEIIEAQGALQKLGGGNISSHTCFLPNEHGERNILLVHKKGKTPKAYPRRPGTPSRNPLR